MCLRNLKPVRGAAYLRSLVALLAANLAGAWAVGAPFEVIHHYDNLTGYNPYYATPLVTGGKVYGMTQNGGAHGSGVLSRCDLDGSNYEVLKHFGASPGSADGSMPFGEVIEYSGKLYGMVRDGGTNGVLNGGFGVIFRCDFDGANYEVVKHFGVPVNGRFDGVRPVGSLFEYGGQMYGMTTEGGTNAFGVLFRCDPDGGNYTILKDFMGSDGKQPHGDVLIHAGKIYGTTELGGANDAGLLFRCDLDGANYEILKHFGGADGAQPFGTPVAYGEQLYGLTFGGGSFSHGVIFRCDLDGGNYTVLKNFDFGSGQGPFGSLLLYGVKLYGMTYDGGPNGVGVLFRCDPDGGNYTVLSAFGPSFSDPTNGRFPRGSVSVSGGKLYGATSEGGTNLISGANTAGVLFRYTLSPSIVNVAPSSGATGTVVSIYGSGFTGATSVTLTGTNDLSFTLVSDTNITATIPALAYTGRLAVYTPSGASTSTVDFVVNHAPVAAQTIPNQSGTYGSAFTFTFDAGTFTDEDGQTPAYSATGLPPGITFDGPSRTFSGTPTSAGTYTVAVVANDQGSPALTATNSFSITVNRAALTLTADNKSKVYGDALPTLTASYSGFVNGDTPASLDTPVSLATTATQGSDVGSYAITASGAADANYTITHANGTLTVTPASLTITADNKSKVYGAALPTLTASYAGFVNGDTPASLDTPVSLTTTATAGSSVGTYPITASGAADANYTITHVNGTLTVTPAALTITADNKSKVYGDTLPTLTASYSGFVNGDTPASLDTPVSLTTTATQGSDVGSYVITASGAADANYTITHANGTLTVTPAALTITADNKSKVYGDVLPTLTASYAGFVNGDAPASLDTPVSLTTAATQGSDVGSYAITASGAADHNYTITYVNGTLTVTPAALTITADNKSKVYGDVLPTLTASYAGFVNGDTPASLDTPVGLTTTATQGSDVGSYVITASGAADHNYTITYVNGTLTVTPAALTITADNKSKVYGDVLPTLTASYAGFVNGDTPASLDTPVSLTTTATQGSDVGSYVITASGAADHNYTITHVNGTLSVTPAALTITAGDKTKVYGEALPTLTASYAGFVNGDTVASLDTPVSLTTTATAGSDVGSYVITASGAADNNYAIAHVNGTLTVTAAALTITADNKSKVYGDVLPALTASYAGFVNGDTPANLDTPVSLTTPATAGSDVGSYVITASGAADHNYTIAHVNGTLTVTPAALTITADNKTKVYGAALPTLTASYAGFVNGDTAASLDTPVSLTTTATQGSDVGSYVITASGAADHNYTIAHVNGTLTVTPAALTITADNKTKVYGAALPTLTASYAGFVNGDTVASLDTPVSLTTTATAGSDVGGYVITASGAADHNYTIAHVNGTLTVTPAALTITADNKSKVYGEALPALTASYAGFVNGDTVASLDTPVSLTTTATAGSDVGSYVITASGAADHNYTIAHVNGTLTVTPAALTITADNKSKVYGDVLPTLTASYAGFVNGDTAASLDTPVNLTTTATAGSDVGSYVITASGAADHNYTIAHVNGTLTVTPAALTITADNKSKVYGNALPTLTASYAGFVNGDTVASLDTPVSLTTTATAASSVGTYPITASGAADANYAITFVAGTLTVTPASLTITADNKSKVYGSALPTLTASYAGFVNGDTAANLDTSVSLTTTATAGSSVGTYPITASGAADLNYTISHVNGTLTVTPAALTITADNKSRAYQQPNPALTATYTGFVNADTPASLDTPVSLATAAVLSSPAGSYPITASGAADANYTIAHVDGILTVNAAVAPSVAFPAATLAYTENGGAVLVDPTATVTDSDTPDFAGGTLTVDFAANGAAEDRLVFLHQGTGPNEIGVSGQDVQYGGVTMGSFSGGANGSTPLVVTLNTQATPDAVQALLRRLTYENVSDLPSTATRTVRAVIDDGHGGISLPATLAISIQAVPDDPVVSWPAPTPIVYGTALGAAQLNATASVPGTFAYTPAAGAVLHAGNGQVLSVTFTPDDTVNYNSATTHVTIDVLPAPLTISADNKTKVYGAALPVLTASYSGFVNGDTPANLDVPVALATTATAGSSVGSYPITASAAADADYSITFVAGTLTVTPAALTITADHKSKIYGDALPTLTASYAGFVNGDTVASLDTPVSLTTTATAASPVGSYPITASGAADANYTITFVAGTLTVTRATLTITADNKSKVYGDALPTLTASYAGFVNGDTPASLDTPVSLTTTATAASSVGSYPITASGAADANYTITFVAGTLTVTPAALTITADNKTKVYGDALPTLTASYAGFVNGDTAASLDTPVSLTTTATAASSVGTYPITASGAADANYTITFVSGTLTVTPAPLTITADNKTKVYGAVLPVLTASYAGFVNGDTVASLDTPVSLTTTATQGSDVGSYVITASGAADLNYTITHVNGTLTITPAALTITGDDKTKVYGAALPTLTASYAGFVNGDTPASLDTPVSLTTTATEASSVGTYPITAGGAADHNYTITHVNGTLTVTPAALTITADNKSKVYGAALPTLTASYAGLVNGDTPASLDTQVTLATTATAASPVGSYPITATGAADLNYTITHVNGTLTVTRAPLTISADDKSRPFLQENPPLTATYVGFVNGDTPASLTTPVQLTTTAILISPPGSYPITASGATAANYTITHVNGTLTVQSATDPVVTLPAGNLNYTENAGPVILDGSATVSDLDTPTFGGGSLTVDFKSNGTADDRLAVRNEGAGLNQIGVSGTNVTYSGLVIGSFTGGNDGSTPLVISLNSLVLPTVAQALLRNVTFENVSDLPSLLTRTVRVVLDDGHGGISSPATMTVSVTAVPDNPTITWPTPAAIVYGTPLSGVQLNATASVPGTFTYTPAVGTVLHAGTSQLLSVSFAPDDAVNYNSATATVLLDVLRAPLTVTADNKSKVYGATLPVLTASYAGFVNGDTAASLDTPVTLTTTATAASSVGGYPIAPSGASDVDYTITFVNGSLTVTPAALTITAENKSKVYGAALPTLTAAYAGFVNGDTPASLDTPVSLSTTATAASSVGTYPITASGAVDLNYSITFVPGTLTVTPAALTITAENKTKVYGAALPALTASYSGFVNDDTPANLDTPVTLATTATAASSVGTYAITASGAADANYTITHVNGTLTVTPAALTITADNKSKVYGAILPTLTASYAGLVNGDTPASLDTPPSLATTATATSAVGSYPITVSGAADVNYTISFVDGTLSVTPAALTITADNKSKVYGAALPTLTASYSGFVNGDTPASLDVAVTLVTTATASSDVGSYPITASAAADANYTVTFVPGTLAVTRAALTITADDKTKVYGAPVPTLTASYAGFVNGDTPASLDTPVVLSTASASSGVGTYPIVAGGASDANYTVVFVAGTLTITPASLTITADHKSKVYGAALPALTASYAGFVNGDTPASLDTPVSLATTATAASAAGSYPITASGASDANYTISHVNGTLSILAASLTVIADSKSMVYGGAVPPLTATYSGLVNGDTPASLTTPASLITLATSTSDVGTYLIVVSGVTSPNYTVTHINGVLTIGKAPLIITAENKTKAYGQALPAFTAAYAGFVNGDTPASLDSAVTFSTPATAASNAGAYPIVPGGATDANYAITFVPGTLTITTVPLTITAENKGKVYGAALPVFTFAYAGLVNGDTPASIDTPPTGSTTATAASHVGTYPITAGGAADLNYTIAYQAGTLTVTPAPLTITADHQVKVYLGAVPVLTASYSGLVNGDTPASLDTPVSLTTTATQTSPVGTYPITASGAADADYTITHVNGVLTVTDLPPQIRIVSVSPAGDVTLQITCQPGLTLDVEQTTDLVTWTALAQLTLPTGAANHVDVGGGLGPKKFYRLKIVP